MHFLRSFVLHSVIFRYLFLVVLTSTAYYPTLFQTARADQFGYLYQTKDRHDLYSLTLGCYALNRDVEGDIHFFRPVLYLLLGLERWTISELNPFGWQAVSLCLHLAVVLLLYRYLQIWNGSRSWLAFLIAAFFGVQYASMELVAWHHLSGYVLFCVLFLGVCCLLARSAERVTRARQAALLLLLLVSAFTLEIGNILSVLVAAYMLGFNRMRSRNPGLERGMEQQTGAFPPLAIAAALAVPVLYTAANLGDQYHRYGHLVAGPAREGSLSLQEGLLGLFSAASLWLKSGFLPSKIDLGTGARMVIVAIHPTLSAELAFQLGLAMIALAAFVLLCTRAIRENFHLHRTLLGVLALTFGVGYAAVLVFLRAGPRGLESALRGSSYYAYIFNLAALVFLASLVDLRNLALAQSRWFRYAPDLCLAGTLAVIASISACRLYLQGEAAALRAKPTRIMVEQILRLQRASGDPKNFTFGVAFDHPGEMFLPNVREGGDRLQPLTASQVFFPHHYSRVHPRFFLWRRCPGFDVVTFGGRVLGIPDRAWPLDFEHFSVQDERRCLVGATLAEVEDLIARQRGKVRKESLTKALTVH